ncbi:MAG: TonB family protein [Cyclobacteriaceae bacterium]|nr:TonB family protein [Cyclobacteriaceae bacterium]
MDRDQDDIRRYLSGEMTPAERHALERRALNDPFLQDAIDGANDFADDFSDDVEDLDAAIVQRSKPARGFSWRIAAGIAAVVMVGSWFYWTNSADQEQLAQNNPAPAAGVENDSIAKDAIDTTSLSKPLLALEQPRARAGKPSIASAGPEEERLRTHAGGATDSVAALQLADATLAEEAEPVPAPEQELARETISSKIQGLQTAPSVNRSFRGRVVDGEGKPIPGVTVKAALSGFVAVTDADGNYQVNTPTKQDSLVFSYVGFETQKKKADVGRFGSVFMKEETATLGEVVITGRRPDDADVEREPIVHLAEPVGGLKAYNDYLESNKQYPQQALLNTLEGRVTLQFTVDVMGDVSEFTVVRSVGHGCDEEVMRLVKEGPKWMPTTVDDEPVESTVKVRLRFTLPGKK